MGEGWSRCRDIDLAPRSAPRRIWRRRRQGSLISAEDSAECHPRASSLLGGPPDQPGVPTLITNIRWTLLNGRNDDAAGTHLDAEVLDDPLRFTWRELLCQVIEGVHRGLDLRYSMRCDRSEHPVHRRQPALRSHRRRLVMRIVTDSRRPEEPKDPETCNVFALYKHFAPDERVEEMRKRYVEGGVTYSLVKEELADLLDAAFDQARDRYLDILSDTDSLDRLLRDGTRRARESASHLLSSIRLAVGGSADQIAMW